VRNALIVWAHGRAALGFAFVLAACAAASAPAAGLARRLSPEAHGSGIPQVEAVLRGELPPASFLLIPVKFLGGVLAIAAGLAAATATAAMEARSRRCTRARHRYP
jgi:chloride channel protein, CIC family